MDGWIFAQSPVHQSNPSYSGVTFNGEPRMIVGGVGRNLAAGLRLLGQEPTFITSLARDNLGEFARNELYKLQCKPSNQQQDNQVDQSQEFGPEARRGGGGGGMQVKILDWNGRGAESSSCFALVLIDSLTGQCEYVIANLEARQALSRGSLASGEVRLEESFFERDCTRPPLVVLDANLPTETMDYILELAHKWRVPVFLEPTDVVCLPDLVRLLASLRGAGPSNKLSALTYLSPNVIELDSMLKLFNCDRPEATATATTTTNEHQDAPTVDQIQWMARELMEMHLPELACLLVTMDKEGLLVGLRTRECDDLDQAWPGARSAADLSAADLSAAPVFKHYPPTEVIESPVSASGAGDCFAAGFISGLINDLKLAECVELGFSASSCALSDTNTVPESLARLYVRGRAKS